MLMIRTALCEEYDKVRDFYHKMIEDMEHAEYSPGWEKYVYPSNEYLMDSINHGQLYVVFENDDNKISQEIVGAMIVNHNYNESYEKIQWPTEAERDEITVIHTLGVGMKDCGKGIAGTMVKYVLDQAKAAGQKVVRLDVLKGNLPAEKVYRREGFQYVDTIPMFYEDTGWTDYEAYEYLL